MTTETLERMRQAVAANRQKITAQSRANQASKLRGRKYSPEHCQHIRDAVLARYAEERRLGVQRIPPNWKGPQPLFGLQPDGYIWRGDWVDGKRVWRLEHRAVMETILGRPLLRSETVHHINGQRDDNRPANLQLRKGRHGTGAVFACADCGSHNVLAQPIAGTI